MTFENIILWLITLAAPAQTLFVLIYGTRSPWYRSLLGRALFTKALALGLLLDLSLVAHWWPDYPGQKPITIIIVALVLAGAWLQLAALLRERYIHSVGFSRTPRGPDRHNGLTVETGSDPVDTVDEPVEN